MKGRRSVALAPQVPMPRQGRLRPTVSLVRWAVLTTTTTSGLRAKCAILGPSHPTMLTNWSLRMQHNVPIVLPERLMATRTLVARALYVKLARQTQQHDPSTKVRAYDVTPAGGPTLKDRPFAQFVHRAPTVARPILTVACPVMHRKGLCVKAALGTLVQRLDTLLSSQLLRVVATRRN